MVETTLDRESQAGVPQGGYAALACKPHATDRTQELRNLLLACKRGLFDWGMGSTRIEPRVLHGLGAWPDEILETLLQANVGDLPSTIFILAMNLPGNLSLDTLRGLHDRYGIRPLSLALHLEDQRRTQTLLQRLELAEVYGRWISPRGELFIQGEADLKALPPGLTIKGEARIEGYYLELVVTLGTLVIRNYPKLLRFRDELRGEVILVDGSKIEPLCTGAAEGEGAC